MANIENLYIGAKGNHASVTINGIAIEVKGGRVTVNGIEYGPDTATPVNPPSTLTLDQDGTIQGPLKGNLHVYCSQPVTLTINGDVKGNVTVEHGSVTAQNINGTIKKPSFWSWIQGS